MAKASVRLYVQGVVGPLSLSRLAGAAPWRVTGRAARRHRLAPMLAATLLGFLVVDCFDDLLDVPRVAFLFYLLVLTSLVLNPPDPTTER